MFHKILTFSLAAILALETPLTAYAAQTAPVQMVEPVESETAEEFEAEDEGEDPQESERPAEEGENPQESEKPTEEGENPQEPEQPEGEENEPQEPEDPGKEELPEAPVDNLPEEDIPPVDEEEPEEIEITVSENSVSENALSMTVFSARSVDTAVKLLSFDTASKSGVPVTLPRKSSGTETCVWYSFTAPKAGRYAFYTEEAVFDSLSDSVYFYLCAEPDKSTMIQNGTPQKGVSLCTSTYYMAKGETLYIGTWTSKTDGEVTYTLRAAYQTAFTKNDNGSYTASLPDGDSVTLRARAGKSRYQLVVESASKKQYRLNNYYCPSDHSERDTFNKTIDDISRQDYQIVSDILPGGRYETVCMVTCSTLTNKFVALLTGMEPLTIEGADSDDIVCVHNATREEHSIALDMESLMRDDHDLKLWCYNAESGENMGEMLVNPWMTYEFNRLEADTEYRFDIRDLWGEQILKSLTYRTKAPSEVIKDVKAEISKDFSKLTVKAKPSWQGTEGRGWLRWKMTDSLGRECEKSQQVSLNKRDEKGYFTVEIDTAANGICLQPGAVYSIQISMEFESEKETVYTAAMPVRVKAPEKAFLQESDVTFKVEQDGCYTEGDQKGRPKVTVTVEVPETAGIANAGYFYRPVNEGQKYVSDYLQLEAGKAKQSISLYLDQVGLDFEFILSVGGIKKKETLGIEHELGLRLNRVEASTDETGPFHFVRTYKITGKEQLTGTYYLQLEVLPQASGSSQIYESKGKSVELNQANGYQATVSTLDVGWVPEPDVDYRLRWVLSKTKTVSYNENLLAVVYESLHTGKPHINLKRLKPSRNSQSHQVTLGEEDIAVLKKSGTRVSLYPYMREKGAVTYTKGNRPYDLTPGNNYSEERTFGGLKADTEYEFSLRDQSGEKVYARDVFRTAMDTRTVTISKTEVYLNKVNLHYTLSGFDNYSNDYVVCWYRQAGITGAWKKSNAYRAWKDGYFTLPNLKENTAYEYAVGIGRQNDEVPWLEKTVRGSITTKTDTRRIEVSYKPRMTSVKITCKMFDMGVAENNTVTFFLREKGQAQWKKKATEQYRVNEAIETFSLEGLREDTVYEYRVGFAENDSAAANDLKRTAEGELKTAKDARTVEAAFEPRAYSVRIRYALSDMEGADDGYLLGYVRKSSGTGDSTWKNVCAVRTGEEATEDAFVIGELEEETAYELIMGFGTEENTARDSLRRAKIFPFTTMPDGRSLSGAQAEVGDVSVTLQVKFAGNVERHASYVHFFYRVKRETAYRKVSRVVNMSGVEEETVSVTVTGLPKETEYEFAAVLTDSTTCGKPEDVTREAYKTFGSFTTSEAVKPTTLKISQEHLYLNANALYNEEKGFGYETLKVRWEPSGADADLVWKSSDETVAKVAKDGRVTAVAAGKATITAVSAYASEVSVSCEVTVGDYQIARKGADGSISLVEGAKLAAVREGSYEGYVLGSAAGQSPVEVSAAEVVSGNESIAQWTDGVITTKRAGETRLVFTSEADHVKAFLTVAVQPSMGKGFAITGFKAGASSYPAIKEDAADGAGREQYTMAYQIMSNGESIYYTAVGEIMPASPGFDSKDFNWSIDDPEVATVNEKGTVMPKKAGDAVLRVEPKNIDDTALYKTQVCEVALHIKAVPPYDSSYVPSNTNKNPLYLYVLENTYKKLGDVKFPEGWEGWKWKYPDMPLVINGENRSYYSFRAVYEGESYYPYETSIGVKIGRVTGITACEAEGGDHNNVLEVGSVDSEGNPTEGSDSLTLCVEALFNGDIDYAESLNYTWKVEVNAPAGLVLKEGEYKKSGGRLQKNFTVTAVKKGNYTLTPVIKVTDPKTNREKVLSKTSFKMQAVEEKQAYITLTPVITAGIVNEQGRIVADFGGSVKSFQVRARLIDRNKKEAEAFEKLKLTWSSSDNKVVTVKVSKDTHSAEVKIVGEGHAILTAKVKDKAGHTATARVEIRNLAPRVDVSKVMVNPAYDYDSAEGRRLAFENAGAVEIVPVYGVVSLGTAKLWKNDTRTPEVGNMTLEPDLELVKYEEGGKYSYLIRPTESAKDKVYDCYLGVESLGLQSEPSFYPLKVTVKTKQPQVTVKLVRAANLFYRTDPASVDIGTSQKGVMIESVRWTDSAEGENGFSSEPSDYKFDTVKKGKNVERLYFAQESIRITDKKKLAEPGIVSGKVEIRCKGYREALEKPVTLKWNYKKPAIVVKEKEATLIPALDGYLKGSFDLFIGESQLRFRPDGIGIHVPWSYYNELTFHNKDFIKSSFRDYTYVGSKTKGSEKLTMTIVSDYWREPLSAVHTVKFANPTPYLTKAKLVLNTGTVSTAYTDIELKNAYTAALACDDIIIEGKNEKSQALLDEDLLEMGQECAGSSRIVVRLNRARTMKRDAIKNGTYDFKVTPCFQDASGNRIEGKTLTLKIQATNKPVTAKVKLSGSLDLSQKPNTVKNYVEVRMTPQNIGDNYSYDNSGTGFSLVGEYSNYFSVFYVDAVPGLYRIRINKDYESRLKAGQRYRLAIRFTLKMENGDTVQVQTPTFSVKPKQSVPKVTVHGNSQTLFAGNDKLVRTCGFELPDGMGYRIKGISGGLDCNKDGKQDISISWVKKDSTDQYAAVELKLADRDGALTVSGAKGKTYNIPVTMTLEGRDGIAKDVKTSIKVTVRR